MRTPAFTIFSLIALLSSAGPAYAQPLNGFPGWRLDQVAPAETVDTADLEYKDFFTLAPPGPRPPITVDGGTAARLFNGQANPETIYSERIAGAANTKKEESSGGGSAVGWQIAESTYVPIGEEKNHNSATAMTGSSTYGGAGNASGGAGTTAGSSASMGANVGGFGAGAMTGAAVGGGSMGFANSGSGGSNPYNSFNGGTAGKGPAYTGSAGGTATAADTSNMTYSQMIESANAAATKSACARMGSYAQGGFCR